jgi:calcyphosin
VQLREVLAQRCGGLVSLKGLSLQFDFMARKTNLVSRENLERGLQTYLGKFGVYMKPSELDEVFKTFDRNNDGRISFDEFIRGVRGEMNARRRSLVLEAFRQLDKSGAGSVSLDDIAQSYDTSKHPGVVGGKITRTEALSEFMKNWDKSGDNKITQDEFIEYYEWLSPNVDHDDYFELMMRNAWHLSGGEGWAANTTCLRVLVTHKDGRQSIEEIKNDLGVSATDTPKIIERLRAQGFDPARVETSFAA